MEFQWRPRWQGKLENFLIGQGKVTCHPYCVRNVKVLLQLVRCGFCFYHTTLCVSAVFAVARCPSVCPSVALVDCIQTAEDIARLLSQPDSHIILVFLCLSAGTQFQGERLQWGHKICRVGKFWDFQLKSPFISEVVRDRPMVAMECQ